jgi:hypothetical protein
MNILLATALMFCATSVNYPVDTVFSVVTNYASMYKTASLNAEKYEFNIDNGEKVSLLNDNLENNFYFVSYRYDSVTYQGYVYKECLAVLEDEQELILTYNAKTGVKTQVFDLNDTSKEIAVLDENTEVYLYEGYNRKTEFTAVKFSYEGKIMLGYIPTINISPYGISNVLIVSITAIIACVGVIFILLGISKKKTKKKPVKDEA